MNKNIAIGGLVVVIALGGIAYYMNQNTVAPAVDGTLVTTVGDTPNQPVSTTPGVVTPTPAKPVATTNATVAPTDTTAVVTGTVVPNGSITTYWYEYGTTKSLGKKTSNQIAGSGYSAIPTPGYITGLAKSTTYYFQLIAENEFGRVTGAQNTVTTTEVSSPVVGTTPTVSTLAATGITATSVTLKGQVNPNKESTQYWFEYGTLGSLGTVTTFVSIGNGKDVVQAGATAPNLQPGTTYYFRINAQNQFGTVNGAILTFKTAGKLLSAVPVVTTQVPSSIGTTTAIVRGTVNTSGGQTSYWFEYSTDTAFAPASTKSTQQKSIGGGETTLSVQANLARLNSHTTYYTRVVAQNSGGVVHGDTQSFQTK